MEARILLEDGTLIQGKGFGSTGTTFGEIVFNTGMTGYQEILTDPSYAGQIVTMTYPLIGNYGVNPSDIESDGVKVSGFVVKEYSKKPSHWEISDTLEDYLKDNGIVGVYDVDTRMITKRIRNVGAMNCVVTTDETLSVEELELMLGEYEFPRDIVEQVTTAEVMTITSSDVKQDTAGDQHSSGKAISIGVVDLGLKKGIVKQLLEQGCVVTVYPSSADYATIMEGNHDGILFSNGPGDPKDAIRPSDWPRSFMASCLCSASVWGIRFLR